MKLLMISIQKNGDDTIERLAKRVMPDMKESLPRQIWRTTTKNIDQLKWGNESEGRFIKGQFFLKFARVREQAREPLVYFN
jgi:hypothetical protein